MDVRLPNGTIIRGVPDGTSRDVVMQKAISAGLAKAEDFPQAETVTGTGRRTNRAYGYDGGGLDIFGESRQTDQTRSLPELQDSGLLAGEDMGRAAAISPALLTATNPDEIAQIITKNFPNVGVAYNKDAQGNVYPILRNNETGAVAQVNKPGLSAFDVIQGLGLAAAYTPAGRSAGMLSAATKAGATETALQGAQSASGGEFNPEDVALSAALGGGLKGAEDAAGGIYRAAIGGAPVSDVVAAGRQSGIPVLTSDVFQPQTFPGKMAQQTAEKIPIVGTAPIRQEQQAMRQEAVDRVADQYSDYSYTSIVDSLKAKSSKIKSAAGSVLESTGQKADDLGDIPLTNTIRAIDDAKDVLSKPGVMRTGTGLEDLKSLSDTLASAPQTFTTLKENRTAFREIVNSFDSSARSQLTSREKAMLEKVQSAMTDDMKAQARKALTPREYMQWEKANAIYADEAKKLTRTKLKNILDKGDVTPESVKGMLFSGNGSEVNMLYNSLGQQGKANARAAIISRIVNDSARTGLTPNSFLSGMKKYGPQISVFFKGGERKQLEGLRAALEATRRAQDAAVTTPTGQQLIGGLSITGLYLDPIATLGIAGTVGGLARVYESAPVRSALLRLRSAPKGSTQFEKALADVQSAVATAAQAVRAEQQGQ